MRRRKDMRDPGVRRAFYTYTNMMTRCYNTNYRNFDWYGGRGIGVCDVWRFGDTERSGFIAFLDDMGVQPEGLTIERKDNDAGYSPENCVWATRGTQARNRRTTRIIDTPWGRMCVRDAAEKAGVAYATFIHRLDRGYTIAEALVVGDRRRKQETK